MMKENYDMNDLSGNSEKGRFDPLASNDQWLNLKHVWNLISCLLTDAGLDKKSATYREIRHVLGGRIDEGLENIYKSLQNQQLLKDSEIKFLKQTIFSRYNHIMQESGMATCYMMIDITKERQTLNELETKYNFLRKLHQENKLNTKTYDEVKIKLFEDFKSLQAEIQQYNPDVIPVEEDFIELIIEINK